jgi:hypothetical protein
MGTLIPVEYLKNFVGYVVWVVWKMNRREDAVVEPTGKRGRKCNNEWCLISLARLQGTRALFIC